VSNPFPAASWFEPEKFSSFTKAVPVFACPDTGGPTLSFACVENCWKSRLPKLPTRVTFPGVKTTDRPFGPNGGGNSCNPDTSLYVADATRPVFEFVSVITTLT